VIHPLGIELSICCLVASDRMSFSSELRQ